MRLAKKWLFMKNLQFLSNFDETLPKVPINEVVNWTKFDENWTKIVEFSLIVTFNASLIFYESVSSMRLCVLDFILASGNKS